MLNFTMEASSRHPLHFYSKLSLSYPPLINHSEMYSTHQLDYRTTSEICPINENLKKENFFVKIFKLLTGIISEQLDKIPTSFSTNLIGHNSLSVSIVPNEEIISREFFNNLNCNVHMKKLKSSENLEYQSLEISEDKSPIASVLIIPETKSLITYCPSIPRNKNSMNTLPSISEDNSSISSSKWQKNVNSTAENLTLFSSVSKTCTRRHPFMKDVPKSTYVSSGRGRGRGKSQLRRNGVSQSTRRKEKMKHELYADIQDDLDTWEELEAYSTYNCLRKDKDDFNDLSDTDDSFCFMSFEMIDDVPKNTNENCRSYSRKTDSVPDNSVDERIAKCTMDKFVPRHRFISETSEESEDNFIVFEEGSDSDTSDFDYLIDDEISEEETGNQSETKFENKTVKQREKHKVRFNLKPTVHRIIKWDFAYRAARPGPWEQMARDRERFKNRIRMTAQVLEPILATDFRNRIWERRFAGVK